MRMWMVPPKLLCNKHLTGEHVEMHMFAGSINKGTSMAGYIHNGLMQPYCLEARHDALAKEMAIRGMNHKTPIQKIDWTKLVPETGYFAQVDAQEAFRELHKRCEACRDLAKSYGITEIDKRYES